MSEELQNKVSALRNEYDQLLNEVAMTDVTQALGDTATQIAGLPEKIKEIREAGYAYANYLEHKTETLDRQWNDIRNQIEQAIRRELIEAQNEADELDDLWDQLDAALNPTTPAVSKSSKGGGLAQMMRNAQQQAPSKPGAPGGMLANMKKAAVPQGGSMGAALSAASGKGALSASGINEGRVKSLIDQLDSAMDRTKRKIDSAKGRVRGLYGQVPSNVSQTLSQLQSIHTYLERSKNATFQFKAGEDVFIVVKAEWKNENQDNPDGMFYITNQRVLMEQAEKKGGFLGFGGKKVEGLLWEAPIGSLQKVDFEKKGLLGRIDLIHLQFGSGGPFAETTVELNEGGVSAKWFASKLKQAISGEIEKERGLQRDQALVEAIADAPTTCPVCGATFDQEITRGMTQLQCSYCGTVVRLAVS